MSTTSRRHRRRNVPHLLTLTVIGVLLIVTLVSSLLFIPSDELRIVDRAHASVKSYQSYAAKKLGETYKYIFDDGVSADDEGENGGRENACLFSLVRNEDLDGMISSIGHVERRFNNRFHYDWVFVNDKAFTDEFIEKITEACSGEVKFEQIPREYWSYPEWIDLDKAAEARRKLRAEKVMYGGSESYRHMCRFNSGFFYKMPVMQNYRYYWRVEPDIKFLCDIPYDPFKIMREGGKKYGFNMAMAEFEKTIPTLWDAAKEVIFNETHPMSVVGNNLKFISDDSGETYNLCHFWSNFEIADLHWFQSVEYNRVFDHLDKTGGFFYERWGDAPVHTIAASLLLTVDQIQYFDNTGYFHKPNQNCPPQQEVRDKQDCECDPERDFTWHKWSCVSKYFIVNDIAFPEGVVPNHSKRELVIEPKEVGQELLYDIAKGETRWRDEL